MPYIAPFRLPDGQPFLPDGEFLVPLCTTRERLTKMLTVLTYGGLLYGQPGSSDYDHIIDLMRALGWVDDPCAADCFPCEDKCIEYPPYSPIITYSPNDPYRTPNLIPEGFFRPPWYTNPPVPLPGVQPTDAMVNLLSIPNVYAVITAGYPRARISFSGIGELEIEFVKVIQGGYALVTRDGSFIGAQVINCASLGVADIASIDLILELLGLDTDADPAQTEILELKFTSPGDHFVDITFLPAFDLDNKVIGFGGGIRRVSLCGLSTMAYFRLRQNPNDPCLLEQQLQPNGEWLAAFNYELCKGDSRNSYITQRTQNTIINNQRIDRYDGTPGSVNSSAPTTNFNGDGSSAREDALCMAVRAYVEKQAHDAAIQAGFVLTGTVLLTVAVTATILGGIVGGVAVITSAIALAKYVEAANDREAQKRVICDLTDRLKGQTVTEATFVSVLTGLPSNGDPDFAIYNTLRDGAGRRENYLFFLDLLGEAFDVAQAGGNDCPCSDEWCYHFDFRNSNHGFDFIEWPEGNTPRTVGEYIPGTGFRMTPAINEPSARACAVQRQIPAATTITRITFGTSPAPASQAVSMVQNAPVLSYNLPQSQFRIVSSPQQQQEYNDLNWNNPEWLTLDCYAQNAAVSDIQDCWVYGVGLNPFGQNNCT